MSVENKRFEWLKGIVNTLETNAWCLSSFTYRSIKQEFHLNGIQHDLDEISKGRTFIDENLLRGEILKASINSTEYLQWVEKFGAPI